MDTVELGAGKYPEPTIADYKNYTFDCIMSCYSKITISAYSLEDAQNKLANKEYDYADFYDYVLEDVCRYEVNE